MRSNIILSVITLVVFIVVKFTKFVINFEYVSALMMLYFVRICGSLLPT